ncbi:response regulator transcription factor [Actinocorallia populi]|uniref:response regulator transcription factor n=1 Tax=Actinocorallia populi TaxID=2079200 RepID=UPI000D090B30|nr:response regulator transcription factor [Actinocorallia populi]
MRVVIADDAVILRDGLAQLLELRGHTVVAAVKDAEALRHAVAEHGPDIAVIDVRMPPTHTDEGLRAALQMRRDHPGVGIMLFSQYVETRYVKDLVAESAAGVGYLLKERVADLDDFVDALRRVAGGGTALDPEVLPHLLGGPRGTLDRLSPREREVLALMAEGRTNDAIARRLVVSGRAVEKHVANIFTKLGLPPSGEDHRRVLAVLRYLEGT